MEFKDVKPDERRRFYRVEDAAILDITPVQASDLSQPAEVHFAESPAFALMRELRNIEQEQAALQRAISDRYHDIGQYLQGMNRKIEVIARVAANGTTSKKQRLQAIDLSEGGIGFNHSEKLPADSLHALKLWFKQGFLGIAAYVKIVASHRDIEGGYHVSAAFQDLPDADAQIIARHIMQIQAAELRKRRED